MTEEANQEEAAPHGEAARRAEENLRFLAKASDLLALRMEPEEALRNLAELATARLADYCVTYILEEGAIRRVGHAHVDSAKRGLVEALEANGPPSLDDEVGAGHVIRTGRPIFVNEITDDMLVRAARNSAYLSVLLKLRPRSCILVPLQARGRVLGAMAFTFTEDSNRRHADADLQLALELAGRASLLMEGEARQPGQPQHIEQ